MAYALAPDRDEFGFQLGDYDRTQPLVLDPVLIVYCGYIGGNGYDVGTGVAVDTAGNAYVTGATTSTETTFPIAVGPDLSYNGSGTTMPPDGDAFVAKVNASGTALLYCGFIGGAGDDRGAAIAVDAAGNAYVTGETWSTEFTFPVKHGPDLTHNGATDIFLAQVDARGVSLTTCGYIGGSSSEQGGGIAVDASGNAYVTGFAGSTEATFPVTVGPDLTHNLLGEAFVARVSFPMLSSSGLPRPGSTMSLSLTPLNDAGLTYQVGSSLGTGPIPVDRRQIKLSPDSLLQISVGGLWPTIFAGYRGVIDSQGQARAAIHIPGMPALIGTHLHTAFVTLDPRAPSGIRSISDTVSLVITS